MLHQPQLLWMRLKYGLYLFGLFIRLQIFGLTGLVLLLGAALASTTLTLQQLWALLLLAMAYHNYTYVLNDVIDLPIDKTQPQRAQAPLVRGLVQPGLALTFALLQIPLAFAVLRWQQSGWPAYMFLSVSFGCMAIYNVWGKRTAFPPFTDIVQGIAWGALGLCGATVYATEPPRLAWALFAYQVVMIALLNGVHVSLRDLDNDLRSGACTTAILLGARPQTVGGFSIPARLAAYAITLLTLLNLIVLTPILRNDIALPGFQWGLSLIISLGMVFFSARLLWVGAQGLQRQQDFFNLGILHAFLLMGFPVLWFALTLEGWLVIVLAVVFLAPFPFPTYDWLLNALRYGWRVKSQPPV